MDYRTLSCLDLIYFAKMANFLLKSVCFAEFRSVTTKNCEAWLYFSRTKMNKYIVLIFLTLPGLLLSLLAFIFFWVLFPGIIHSQVEQQIRLVEGSDTWNKWRDAPVPIYLTFHIYHVTNPDEVENGLQAKLEEKGPYVYR